MGVLVFTLSQYEVLGYYSCFCWGGFRLGGNFPQLCQDVQQEVRHNRGVQQEEGDLWGEIQRHAEAQPGVRGGEGLLVEEGHGALRPHQRGDRGPALWTSRWRPGSSPGLPPTVGAGRIRVVFHPSRTRLPAAAAQSSPPWQPSTPACGR